MAVKVSSKGQITIPKRIRSYLGTEYIEFSVEEGKVILQPVENIGGALSKYADTSKIREERDAWEKAAVKKHGKSRR